MSSFGETPYSIDSDKPLRKPFDPMDALRTPYRIDIFQTTYFIIDSLEDMFDLAHQDLFALINEAGDWACMSPISRLPRRKSAGPESFHSFTR